MKKEVFQKIQAEIEALGDAVKLVRYIGPENNSIMYDKHNESIFVIIDTTNGFIKQLSTHTLDLNVPYVIRYLDIEDLVDIDVSLDNLDAIKSTFTDGYEKLLKLNRRTKGILDPRANYDQPDFKL